MGKNNMKKRPAAQGRMKNAVTRQPGRSSHLSGSLSFDTQHKLLTHLQSSLEDMCYNFGITWCPTEMVRQGWTQPSRLELTPWLRFLRQRMLTFPSEAVQTIESAAFTKTTDEIAQIRNCAVHRQPQSDAFILQSLEASIAFAKLHRSERYLASFEMLHRDCRELISDLKHQQRTLEQKFQETIRSIATDDTEATRDVNHQISTSVISACNDDSVDERYSSEKVYDPRNGVQLHRLTEAVTFICRRCGNSARSAWVAFAIDDPNQPYCNKCYGSVLAENASSPSHAVSMSQDGLLNADYYQPSEV